MCVFCSPSAGAIFIRDRVQEAAAMADVKRLVFSILTFLEDQKKTGGLDDEQVESLEGKPLTNTC